MVTRSSTDLGVNIGLARWRNLAIANDKKLIRPASIVREARHEELMHKAHVFQAGHLEDVENHYYADLFDMPQGVSDEMLDAFRDVSHGWHGIRDRDWKPGTRERLLM
jgi:hypothetical protein